MTKITIKPDCGNSPKKAFLRDFNIAFSEGNVPLLLDSVSEDIKWQVFGDFEIAGKKAFEEEIIKMLDYPRPKELVIETIITHGREAVANGLMIMGDNTFAFCDVYLFKSAGSKILTEIKSFVVKI
jgi:hypothetical protein